jgi:putative heme-binding domain-containing protein
MNVVTTGYRTDCGPLALGWSGLLALVSLLLLLAVAGAQQVDSVKFGRRLIDDAPPRQPYYKLVGDVNGDDHADIVVAGRAGPLVMYAGPKWEKTTIAEEGYSGGVNGELADIDGDGDLDIVMGGVVWFDNPRLGGGPWRVHRIDQQRIHDVEVADLNRDGRLDVVCRDQSAFGQRGNEIFVYLQAGRDAWKKEVLSCPHGEGLKLSDIDGDGSPDIIIGGLWFRNDSGKWTPHTYGPDWTEPDTKVEVGDIDGDGRPDIVLTPAELKGERYKIAWFQSPGGDKRTAWKQHVIVPDIECVIHSLGLGDFNRDGALDVAYAQMHQGAPPNEVCVMINSQRGLHWQKVVLGAAGSHDIVVADLDRDGDLDIVGANHAGVHPLEMWENLPAAAGAAILPGRLPLAVDVAVNDSQAAKRQAYEQHALTNAGDAVRGRQLFFDEARTKCASCHTLDGKGGDAGPDLSVIGGKFARPHLIESLLEPSRQIVEGFRASLIATTRGTILTGIIKAQSPHSITLVDAEGKPAVLSTAEVERRQESPLSLMPAGLENSLTSQEFTDLIAFLESCRPATRALWGSGVSGGIALSPGFQVSIVATGLTGCTALETTNDGRILICEQTGTLRVVKAGKLLPQPALTLPVTAYWERGLIGVTVDPDFPRSPFVYVCYVAAQPYPHHRVSRFVMRGDIADPASEELLLEGDDQTKLGGKIPAGHQAGALHFGNDGKLYIGIGEQTAGQPSQELNTLLGKLLRINADGSIPADNPFIGQTQGKYRAIWARGLRNPFTFAIRRTTGEIFVNDIGQDRYEEINRIVAGGNYGWPLNEGPVDDPRFQGPIHHYPRASVCGGDFIPDDAAWPASYRGKYFFAEFIHGWIKTLDISDPTQVQTFASGLRNPVDLRFAPDGSLYVLLRNAWVIDDKFQPATGSLLRISRSRGASE